MITKGFMIMDKQSFTMAASIQANTLKPALTTGNTSDSVKDTGYVRVGGGMLRFIASKTSDSVRDTGRVRVGGGMLRF